MGILIEHIIDQLNAIHEEKIWIGANFEKRINDVNEEEAFIRPLHDLHSVAEIVSHLTAWRKDTIVKIKSGKGNMTENSEENWITNERLRNIGWQQIKRNYKESLCEFIETIRSKEDSFLDEEYYDIDFKDTFKFKFVIDGMLHHDLYHLGQVGIVIKFLKLRYQG